MEKFRKSVNICQSYGQKYRGPFFDSQCIFTVTKHTGTPGLWIHRPTTTAAKEPRNISSLYLVVVGRALKASSYGDSIKILSTRIK